MPTRETPHTAPPTRARLGTDVRRDEFGYTLVELIIAMSMFLVVVMAVLSLFDSASRTANAEQERNVVLTQDAAAAANMAQVLRKAYLVNGPTGPALSTGTSSYMDVDVRLPVSGGGQADYRVLYTCDNADGSTGYYQCLQYTTAVPTTAFTAGQPPTGVTGASVLRYLLNDTASDPNDPVFKNLATPTNSTPGGFAVRPTYGTITARVAAKGQNPGSPYAHQIVLRDAFYMRQLDFGR
jgi:type II secretory pathway pseudopilin PulG